MTAPRRFLLFVLLLLALVLTGCQGIGPASSPPPPPNPALNSSINHIVFMAQENRSFDHYFGQLNAYRKTQGMSADIDGLPVTASNPNFADNGSITAFHLLTMCVENPSPSWNEAHTDFNRLNPGVAPATLDGFVFTAAKEARDVGFHDIQGLRAMGYYDASDLPYYYSLATNFATSDRWFSPVMTRTQPNRMYMLAATSAGHVYPPTPGSPQLTNVTIFEALQNAGVTWKVYVTDPVNGSVVQGSSLNMFSFASVHPENIVPVSQYLTDLANGTLPQVAFIDAGYSSGRDEHPSEDPTDPGGSVQVGSAYASSLINALMTSSSWKDSAFILTWDEAGGFYDHVSPQPAVSPDGVPPSDLMPGDICSGGGTGTCDFTYTGFRIPLIVISPFAKKGYVSHTTADYTAILKLIETRFSLPSLTARDAAQPDMTEFFDFSNPPWTTPPSAPVQPTTGPCYLDHLP